MAHAGRAALVTGAGRRLGRAIAAGLGAAGYDVAIHYHRSRPGAESVAAELRAAGRAAPLLEADLSDAGAARDLAPRAAGALGRLDVLVSSAAVLVRQPIEAVTPESWDATLDLNLRAAFFVAQGAISHLRDTRGKIVHIADVGGLEPWPAYVPHNVSKAGVVMLTRGLARALAPEITVNAVAPGPVLLPEEWDEAAAERLRRTTPLGRLGSPADVVAAVRYFLELGHWVTGTVLAVDGGRSIR